MTMNIANKTQSLETFVNLTFLKSDKKGYDYLNASTSVKNFSELAQCLSIVQVRMLYPLLGAFDIKHEIIASSTCIKTEDSESETDQAFQYPTCEDAVLDSAKLPVPFAENEMECWQLQIINGNSTRQPVLFTSQWVRPIATKNTTSGAILFQAPYITFIVEAQNGLIKMDTDKICWHYNYTNVTSNYLSFYTPSIWPDLRSNCLQQGGDNNTCIPQYNKKSLNANRILTTKTTDGELINFKDTALFVGWTGTDINNKNLVSERDALYYFDAYITSDTFYRLIDGWSFKETDGSGGAIY